MKNTATLADVARKAGVSKAAASVVLNRNNQGAIRVGAATRVAILAAAAELGYQASHTARSLATGRTGAIGFFISSQIGRGWANPYFASYLPGAEAACRASGHTLCIATAQLAEAGSFIRSPILAQRRIDALIVAGELEPEAYASLEAYGLPYVVLNAPPGLSVPVIDPLPQLTYLPWLARQGHRRILVTRDRPRQDLGRPVEEVVAGLGRDGVEVEWCVPPEGMAPNWEPGHGLGQWLFRQWQARSPERRPTVIVSNGVLHELYHDMRVAGLDCPRDLQLLGDNACEFEHAFPRFSVVRTDMAGIAAAAVRLLVAAVERGGMVDDQCAGVQVQVDIVPGETTR